MTAYWVCGFEFLFQIIPLEEIDCVKFNNDDVRKDHFQTANKKMLWNWKSNNNVTYKCRYNLSIFLSMLFWSCCLYVYVLFYLLTNLKYSGSWQQMSLCIYSQLPNEYVVEHRCSYWYLFWPVYSILFLYFNNCGSELCFSLHLRSFAGVHYPVLLILNLNMASISKILSLPIKDQVEILI